MEPDRRLAFWVDKVVWREGMNLEPHHFQQWDRFHHAQLHARIRSLSMHCWGFTHIEVDKDRLANGEFAVQECSGVMPDGMVFELSGSLGTIPETRNVASYAEFSPNKRTLGVYLAVPALRREGANVKLNNTPTLRATRYVAQPSAFKDDNTGENEQPIDIARLNVRVLFEGESFQGYTLMQIAEVMRGDTADTFKLNESYVPPCLYVGASEYLVNLASRILQNLVTHRARMSGRVSGIFAQRETTPQDILILGKLAVINANIPLVKHCFSDRSNAPEALFLTLSSLAGQLYTYAPNPTVDPDDYPAYSHENPAAVFNRLETILNELIHDVSPDPVWTTVPWTEESGNVYTAAVSEAHLANRRFFIKTKSSNIPEHRLITEMPSAARITSPGAINAVITAAVPALDLNHTTRLPASVPIDDRASYFELVKSGPHWEHITKESAMSIFIPYHRSQVDIELMAVKG